MSTSIFRHARRIARLIAVGLALASAAAVAAGSDPSGIRLTGVVMVPGEPEWAVIEFPNGEQQIVRAGDELPRVGTVAKILPTSIRLQTPKGPREVNIQWGVAGAAPPVAAAATPAQAAQPDGRPLPGARLNDESAQQIVRAGDELSQSGTVAATFPTSIPLQTPKGFGVAGMGGGAAGGTPPVATTATPAQPLASPPSAASLPTAASVPTAVSLPAGAKLNDGSAESKKALEALGSRHPPLQLPAVSGVQKPAS